jgi:hypothetical protein
MSLLTTVKADSALGYMVGYMVISAVGLGILYSATYFPVLAPRPYISPFVRFVTADRSRSRRLPERIGSFLLHLPAEFRASAHRLQSQLMLGSHYIYSGVGHHRWGYGVAE